MFTVISPTAFPNLLALSEKTSKWNKRRIELRYVVLISVCELNGFSGRSVCAFLIMKLASVEYTFENEIN